jgi:hypothetical protein
MSPALPLSNLQQELLKMYASNIDDADLINIKRFLARYFADKAIKEADDIWDKNKYFNETMRQWLNEDDEPYEKEKTNF